MALFQKRRGPEPTPVTTNGATREPQRAGESAYFELKTRIHRQLIERLDLTKLALLPHDAVQQQIQRIVEDMLASDETPLSRQEREQLVVEVQHETFGLGPIEPLMQDPTVSDILVNGPRAVYVERRGRLERTSAKLGKREIAAAPADVRAVDVAAVETRGKTCRQVADHARARWRQLESDPPGTAHRARRERAHR